MPAAAWAEGTTNVGSSLCHGHRLASEANVHGLPRHRMMAYVVLHRQLYPIVEPNAGATQ